MKQLFLMSFFVILSSCKQREKKESEQQLSIGQKIANAHGFDNWKKIKTFSFGFGGTIEEPNSGRFWVWNPNTNDIKLTTDGEITEYNRNNMDSAAIKVDRAFINDKFWALIPFQIVWDEGTTISTSKKAKSPVKQQELNKIILTYPNKGGYTPGDAYDIYYDNQFIIREWSFRRGNASEPSISNTFENYIDYKGIKIAQDHKMAKDDRNLLIRNIKVELQE